MIIKAVLIQQAIALGTALAVGSSSSSTYPLRLVLGQSD